MSSFKSCAVKFEPVFQSASINAAVAAILQGVSFVTVLVSLKSKKNEKKKMIQINHFIFFREMTEI